MTGARPLTASSFIALDLETTGLATAFDRVTELGAVRLRLDADGGLREVASLDRLVHPERRIPPPIARMTGIDDRMVADAPTLAELWPTIRDFLHADASTILLAHNAPFDLGFLVAEADRAGLDGTLPPTLCTRRLARRAFPHAPGWGLRRLIDWLAPGTAEATHHRALPDAREAGRVFAHGIRTLRARTVADLPREAEVPPPEPPELRPTIPEALQPLARCIEREAPVRIRYGGGSKGQRERPITPLGFYERGGRLFLRAWCHLDDEAKSFRCDRIHGYRPDAPEARDAIPSTPTRREPT